jgi:xylitol oxidase
LAAGYSVSLFTDWRHGTFQQVWCKRRIDQGDRGAPAAGELLGAPAARRPLHIVDGLPPDACTEQLGVPGPWHERLPHFRLGFTPSVGDELQSEFFVDRADGAAALRAVRAVAPALAPLLVTEVRAVAADDLWLSPAFERDSLAIHVTWVRDEAAVTAALPALEAGLAPFDPRPHWGKLTTLPPEVIRSRFPRFDDFTALVDDLDPGGTFSNPYLERLRG